MNNWGSHVIVTWAARPPASRVQSPDVGAIVAELATGRSGNHRPDGFCLIPPGALPGEAPADIRDLARMVGAARAVEPDR